MRFNAYLITEDRAKTVDLEEAKTLLKKNCRKALYGYTKGNILYRGMKVHTDYALATPKAGRTSANTSNYYTLMIDNFKQWKDYPKRNRSFICSSSFGSAMNYGTLYGVFPYDGTKVGVCPVRDIWLSFNNSFSGSTLNEMNIVLVKIFERAGISLDDSSYSGIIKSFNQFDRVMQREGEGFMSYVTKGIARRTDWFSYWYPKKKTFQAMMEFLLDPKLNDFKLVDVGGDYGNENECWFDAKCIMIRKEVIPTRPNPLGDILKEIGYNV